MKKLLKRFMCAFLVMIFILLSTNVAFAIEFKYPERQLMYPKRYNASLTNVDGLNAYFDLKKFNDYMVEQLYMVDGTIEKGVIDLSQFSIPGSKTEDMAELIWYNSPELFPINGLAFSVETGVNPSAPDAEYIDALYFSSPYTQEESKKMHTKMVSNAEVLLYGVKNNSSLSELEKALILHDRLISFNEYDYENYESGLNNIPDESYNAYGALGLGVSVCMGYTLAYDYLLEQVGIKSDYCSSDTLNHAWNVVYIDGKPYHVDTTWDDPVLDVTGRVWHDNFLRSTEGIKATGHNADDFTTSPVDTTYDSYFWQNMRASFEVIGSKLYYFDEADKKIYAANDISNIKNKTSLETIDDLSSCKWFGGYTTMANTKLGSAYGLLYYTAPNAIYCYDPSTKKITTVLTPEEVLADIANYGSDFSIAGMNVFGCVISGEYYNDDFYDNLSVKKNYCFKITTHQKSTEWVVVTPATTTTSGKKILKCTKCDEILKSEEIPAVGEHTCNWSEWKTVTEATCSKEGEQISICSICNAERRQTLQIEHNFTEYTTQPTCNATGLRYNECSVCKTRMILETIPATGSHVKSTYWVLGKAATCGAEGYEYLPCVGCGKEMETRTLPKLPQNCDITIMGKVDPTCTKVGYTGDKICKVCNTISEYGTQIPANGHKPSDWIVEREATVLWEGYRYKKCTVCGIVVEEETIPKTQHKYDDGVITIKPTCTGNGIRVYTCTKCGETKEEIISATGHTEIVVPAVTATCINTGLTEGKKCSVCNTILVAQQVTPKAEHKTTLVGAKPATFEADGHTGNEVCTVCNQTINTGSVIPKLTLNTPTVTGTVTNAGIQVNWNAVENAQGYVLYKRVYDASTKKWGKWQIINANVTDVTYLDSDVTLGTSYRYTVRAKYGTALSGYTSSATIKYNVTPTVKVANASNGIKVSWSIAANATGYTVYRSTYSNGKWSGWKNMGTAKANKTAWVDKNVKTGVAYKYTVRAAYGKVLSSYNKSGASVVFLNTPAVKIANNATGMKVAWSKVAGATGYVIYSSQYDPATNSWSKWSNRGAVNTNSWIDTAVQSGVTYKYTVRALNGKSLSAYVSSGALMYLAQPTVKIANAQAGINVSWSQSAGALGYTVYRSEYDAKTKKWSSWKNRGTATADKSSWVDKKVTSGKYYKYTVRAINGNAKSTFVSTGGMIFLAQPAITVKKDTNANVISWNKVNGATGYRVFRKLPGETKWSTVATVKNTSCSDTNVNDESTYTYTVRAYKGKVWSSYDINGVTINRNYKQAVFDLVNIERAKAGLSPLEYYTDGQLAGDIRANEIAKKFAHERPDGNSCFTVFEEVGISCYSAGENIAMGFNSPEAVMDAWMNSEGHRANILNPSFTHMIVGYDAETKSWVQLFLGNPYVQ